MLLQHGRLQRSFALDIQQKSPSYWTHSHTIYLEDVEQAGATNFHTSNKNYNHPHPPHITILFAPPSPEKHIKMKRNPHIRRPIKKLLTAYTMYGREIWYTYPPSKSILGHPGDFWISTPWQWLKSGGRTKIDLFPNFSAQGWKFKIPLDGPKLILGWVCVLNFMSHPWAA